MHYQSEEKPWTIRPVCLSLRLRILKVPDIEWFPDCFFRCLQFYLLNLYYLAGVSSPIRFLPREAFIARLPLASWGPGFGRRQVGLCTVEESYPGVEVSGPSMFWLWTGRYFATMTTTATPPITSIFNRYMSLSWKLYVANILWCRNWHYNSVTCAFFVDF